MKLAAGLFLFGNSVKERDRPMAAQLKVLAEQMLRSDPRVTMELGVGIEAGGIFSCASSATGNAMVINFQINGGSMWAESTAFGVLGDDGLEVIDLTVANMDAAMAGEVSLSIGPVVMAGRPPSSGGEQQALSTPQAAEAAATRAVAPSVGKVVPTNAAGSRRSGNVIMGLFDELKKAFENEEFKEDDQRVRASHILCKGDDDIERVTEIMAELGGRVQQEPDKLVPIFAELARRESECSSSSVGGDLGLFGPGKMVQEFDAVLFPEDAAQAPPAGAVLGPVVSEFGCHLILVTKREVNRDQVEEKLARND